MGESCAVSCDREAEPGFAHLLASVTYTKTGTDTDTPSGVSFSLLVCYLDIDRIAQAKECVDVAMPSVCNV